MIRFARISSRLPELPSCPVEISFLDRTGLSYTVLLRFSGLITENNSIFLRLFTPQLMISQLTNYRKYRTWRCGTFWGPLIIGGRIFPSLNR
jgi:hypothetical protein